VRRLFGGAVLVLCAIGAALLLMPAFGSVSGKALGSSLARKVVGDKPPDGCARLRNGNWRCEVLVEGGSDSHTWWLRLDGRCWTGSLSADLLPPRTRGCVGLRDQVLGF
jgi:hypothetical protein